MTSFEYSRERVGVFVNIENGQCEFTVTFSTKIGSFLYLIRFNTVLQDFHIICFKDDLDHHHLDSFGFAFDE